jgi:adenylate cyclase
VSLSFRSKLFIALLGIIAPLLAIVLLTVNSQTKRQLDTFTTRSFERARVAFAEAERSNRGRLEGLGQAFALAPRTGALLNTVLMTGLDTGLVANNFRYDLQLAGEDSALVAITDIDGRGIAGISRGRLLPDPSVFVPRTLVDSMLARGDTAGFGYQMVGDNLYSVYVALIRIIDQPSGFLIIGRPIDTGIAESLGHAVEGSVCFVADDRCVAASTRMTADGLTGADMVAATHEAGRRIMKHNGKRWLVIADPLAGGNAWRVIARPLDEVLLPFEQIRDVLLRIGIAALFLATLFAVVFARGLARPIRALVEATTRVARGDFTSHVPVTSRDELGTLSAAFNEMTNGLRLKETYRGLLDKVISPEIADEMLSSDISLGGENREVTVLFADIRGFTSFTEDMEPQEVIRVLNEAMDLASAVVEREGGVVDKYIGDEIMALFGAPVSHEDDAVRAVRAAVGIRDAVDTLSLERTSRGERGITMGIGINTGVVVAGNMGSDRRLNYTVLGMSVNIAARLCSQADPQEILMGEATYERVKHCTVTQPAGHRTLRGLSHPLATYALSSVDCVIIPVETDATSETQSSEAFA